MVPTSTPTRMKPAWLIDEYAIIRFTLVWTMASTAPDQQREDGDGGHGRLPVVSGRCEGLHEDPQQGGERGDLGAEAKKPVTGVGAPW